MRFPYAKHLEWLLLEGTPHEEIISFYDNIQLPVPSHEHLATYEEKIASLVIPPGAKKRLLRKQYNKELDLGAWDRLGYGPFFLQRCGEAPQGLSEVGKILNHPVMRIALDCVTIARMDDEKILLLLPQGFNLALSEEALKLYRQYFGNFDDFSKKDWQAYLNLMAEDRYAHTRFFTALTRPADEVLHLCGLPTQKQFSDFLKNVLATANYRFNHYARVGSPEADLHARKWAKVGIEAGEKFEKFGAGDANDFAKLVQTEFEYVTPDIETLDESLAQAIRPQIEEKSQVKGSRTPPPVAPNSPDASGQNGEQIV